MAQRVPSYSNMVVTRPYRGRKVVSTLFMDKPNRRDRHRIVDVTASSTILASNTSGSYIEVQLKRSTFTHVRDLLVGFKITESGAAAMELLPVPLWFDRVEFFVNGGAEKSMQTLRPEASSYYMNAFKSDAILRNEQHLFNNGLETQTHPASTVIQYYLPLEGSFMMDGFINGLHLAEDIFIRLYPRSSGVVESGSGTPTLTSCTLYVLESDLPADDVMRNKKLLGSHVHHNMYLDWQFKAYSRTLAASTEDKFELDAINGKVPFMFVTIRASNTTNSTLTDFVQLGKLGQLDIVDKDDTSYSVIGKNSMPLELQQYFNYSIGSPEFGRDLVEKGVYVLQFCENPVDCFRGHAVQYLDFMGGNTQKYYLKIVPSAAGTDQVVGIVLTNAANDGGSYSLSWGGDTTIDLAFGATVATMKAAIENLTIFRQSGAKVTCSGTAATSFNITISGVAFDFVQRYGLPVFNVQDLNDGTVAEKVNSIGVSTDFVNGVTGTGALQVNVWAPRFKNMFLEKGMISDENH